MNGPYEYTNPDLIFAAAFCLALTAALAAFAGWFLYDPRKAGPDIAWIIFAGLCAGAALVFYALGKWCER